MSIEIHLQDVANHIQNLVACSTVNLCLGCTEPALQHPLLSLFASMSNRPPQFPFLHDERVRALCDIAIHTGATQYMNHREAQQERGSTTSIAVAPLECPGGILGFILCTDTRPDAFLRGEQLLLDRCLPVIARSIEKALCDAFTLPICAEGCWTDCIEGADGPDARHQLPVVQDIITDVQEQSAFISMVCHELRVPLTAIKGYAGLLQAYGPSGAHREPYEDVHETLTSQDDSATAELTPTLQRHYLDVIMEQSKHLEVLISDLLDISRIQTGRLALRHTQVDVVRLCQRVAQLVQHRVDQQEPGRYYIQCSGDSTLPMVWADPDRVQQVLTNLVENAVKYSPNGGLIEIQVYVRRTLYPVGEPSSVEQEASASRGPLMTHVTVCDRGVGIPRQQQSSLFKPFSRIEHPATRRVPGLGLGLYISRTLVEAMDGSVSLCSNEDEGTSVTFTLPVELPNEMPEAVSFS